jgi:GTP pyrophosphokinase
VPASPSTRPVAHGAGSAPVKSPPLTLRGVEGVAIQYAKCCRPIPGDILVGQFRKGQGLVVHTRDCITLKKQRIDPDQLIDVEWADDVEGVFVAGMRLLVADRRGLLADLAMAIADADANIDNVSMERPDGGDVLAMFFSVQVKDRRHLAQVMRSLKRIAEVKRLQRASHLSIAESRSASALAPDAVSDRILPKYRLVDGEIAVRESNRR